MRALASAVSIANVSLSESLFRIGNLVTCMRAEMFFAQANNRVDTSQTSPGCLEFCVSGFTNTILLEAQHASSGIIRAIKERISAQCSASVFVLTDQKGVSLSDLFQAVDSDRFHSPQQERQRQNSSARWETLALTRSLGQCMEQMVLPLPSTGFSFDRLSTALAALTKDRKTHTVVYALAIVNCFGMCLDCFSTTSHPTLVICLVFVFTKPTLANYKQKKKHTRALKQSNT